MKTTLPARIILLRATLLAFLMMFSVLSFSQNTAGKDFWLAQTPNLSGASFTNAGFSISVSNVGTLPAAVTITNPARPTVNAVVQPNSLQMFTFSSENENIQTTGTYINNVYHITSDKVVVVNSYTPLTNVISNDGALIFPVPALGKRHIVASYISTFSSANSPSGYASWNAFYSVVANQNATNVKVYNPAGILVDNVTLNQGECYQRMNGATPANDVTGYYIESTKPVSVFSGTQATAVGTHQNAQDHIYEQIMPIETLSNSYLAAPSNNRPINCTTCTEDIFRYVATEDNTVITTSPNVGSGILNKGQYIEVFTSIPHVVTGTKPFYGYQYLTSQRSGTVQGLTGDPDLIGMPVVDQFLFNTVFAIPNTFDYNFVTITAPSGINLSIDDTVRTPLWKTVGVLNGITYKTASIKVYPGSHKINGDKKLGFYCSSFSTAASISYMGGSGMEPINAGCITGGPYQVTTCVPGVKQVQLNGTAGCSDGSTPTSILWTSEDGVIFSDPTIANPIATLPGNGRYNISLTVNCSGNVTSCTSEIAVIEPIGGCSYYPAPSLEAPPYKLVPTDNNQSYASSVTLGIPTYTSIGFTTITNDAPAHFPVGTTIITWTLRDALDRTVSDTQHVTVFPPPTIQAPDDIIVNNDPGLITASGINLGTPVYASYYGPTSVSNTAVAVYPLGNTLVIYTITDGFSRTASDTQIVTVMAPPPTILAPPTVTLIAGFNGFAMGVDLRANGNESYTTSVNPTVVSNTGATQYSIGTTNVTWTVTDGLGRTANDVQQVIVVAPRPLIAPPADITISNDNGQPYSTAVVLVNPVYSAVGPVTLTNDAPLNGQFPIGTTTVTWTLTDAYGNTVTTSNTVTVVSAPPTIVAPPAVTVNANPGQNYATSVVLGNATYTVSVNSAVLTNDAPAQFPVGNTTVTWTVKDGLGRTASATQIVTVKANTVCQFVSSITSVPTDNTPTGGNANNLYIGYGAQSTKLQVTVPNTGGPYTFQWTGSRLNNMTSAAPIFTPGTVAGNYTFYVAVKNASGCTSTSSISICVRDVRSLDKNGKWDGKKVIVCHLPPGNPANVQMIDVSINAVPAHVPLHGGDGLGNTCVQPSCSSPFARGSAPVVETFAATAYPNPSNKAFALTVKSDDKYTDINIRIIDAFGRTVEVIKGTMAGRTVLFGDGYANGTYYAEVIQGSDKKLIPLVKAK